MSHDDMIINEEWVIHRYDNCMCKKIFCQVNLKNMIYLNVEHVVQYDNISITVWITKVIKEK